MRSSIFYTLATAAVLTSAAPLGGKHRIMPRQNSTEDPSVEFAGILEIGVTQFYSQFAAKFNADDYRNAGFSNGDAMVALINEISGTEEQHLKELQGLSANPFPNCTFDFSPALTDPLTALSTARVAENVAVGAYLGAVTTETNPSTTEIFSEIMNIEAQHAEALAILLGGDPASQAFALGMTPSEALAAFVPFKPSCDAPLPVQPNPTLTITTSAPFTNTSALNFDLSGTSCANQTNNFCQILTGDDNFSKSSSLSGNSSCSLEGINGIALVYVTNSSATVPGDVLKRGNLPNLCAGPAVILVDPAVPSLLTPKNSTA